MPDVSTDFSFKSLLFPFTVAKAVTYLVLIGLLLFSPHLLNGFTNDDSAQIVTNTAVHSLSNIPYFFSSSTFYNGGSSTGVFYRPFSSLTFAVIYSLAGPTPFLFHCLS